MILIKCYELVIPEKPLQRDSFVTKDHSTGLSPQHTRSIVAIQEYTKRINDTSPLSRKKIPILRLDPETTQLQSCRRNNTSWLKRCAAIFGKGPLSLKNITHFLYSNPLLLKSISTASAEHLHKKSILYNGHFFRTSKHKISAVVLNALSQAHKVPLVNSNHSFFKKIYACI